MHDLGLLFKMIHNRLEKGRNIQLSSYNLTGAQMDVLLYLFQHKGESVSQKEIGAHLDVCHTSIIDILRNLEKKHFIVRKVNEENARYRCVSITSLGEEVILSMGELKKEVDGILFAGFQEEELRRFSDYLNRVYKNLDKLVK